MFHEPTRGIPIIPLHAPLRCTVADSKHMTVCMAGWYRQHASLHIHQYVVYRSWTVTFACTDYTTGRQVIRNFNFRSCCISTTYFYQGSCATRCNTSDSHSLLSDSSEKEILTEKSCIIGHLFWVRLLLTVKGGGFRGYAN